MRIGRALRRVASAGLAIGSVFLLVTCDLDKIVGGDNKTRGAEAIDSTDLSLLGGTEVTLGGTMTLGVTSSSVNLAGVIKRYTSSQPTIIAIDSLTGIATGVAIGTAKLTARLLAPELGEGVTKSQDVRVRYKGIRITAPTVTDSIAGLGQSRGVTVLGLNNAGALVTGALASPTLTSSDTTIFWVSGQTVVARKNGSARVIAVFDSFRDSVLFKVRQVAKSITYPTTDYTATAVNADLSVPLTVKDVADAVIASPTIAWRVTDTTVATIVAGVLRLKKNDTTRVLATVDTVTRGQKIVVAQVVNSLTKLAGTDAQTDTVALPVAISPTVTVLDAGGTPVPNASVTFRVATGGGKITDSVKTTGVNGQATLGAWTLGDLAGPNTVIAMSGSASTTFTATGVAGVPRKLAFSVQPTSASVGTVIVPPVKVVILDSLGNPVTSSTINVTLGLSSNPGAATLGGTLTVAAVGGVATFSNLTVSAGGSGYALGASAPALTGAISNGFDAYGPATKLGFATQPSNVTAGAVMTPAVQVVVQDASGATVANATNTVTLSLSTNPSGATLGGTVSVSAVAGVATFSNLTLNQLGTGYVLTAASTGLTSQPSTAFNVVAVGPATKLVFSVQPSNVVAGASISPSIQVTVQDASGVRVPSSSVLITISIDSNPGASTLGGTTAVAASNGVATFSNISLNKTGAGYKLKANATSLTGAVSNPFNVTPGTATKLAFLQQPTHTVVSQIMAPAVTVAIQDANSNTVTSQVGTNVALALTSCSATLAGTTTASTANNVATFGNLSIATQVSNCILTATATAGGLTSATSSAFNVVAVNGAVKLGFITTPLNTTAGSTLGTIQVALQDASGATVTTAPSTTVTLALGANPASGTLTGTLTASTASGIATFSGNTLAKAATGYTLAATATGYQPATSGAFNVTAGTATKVGFVQQPTTSTAGVAFSPAIQVAVQDTYGNTVTSSSASVTLLFSSSGTLGGSFAGASTAVLPAVNGVVTYTGLRVNKANTGYILLATSTALTSATSSSFNIDRAPASLLAFSTQPNASYTAGGTISVTVQTQDSVGNVYADPSAAITLSVTGGAAGAALNGTKTVTPVSGSAAFTNLSIDKAGTLYQLNASASGFATNGSNTFTINPGSATKLGWIDQPQATFVSAPLDLSGRLTRIAIQDALGNTVTTNNSTTVRIAVGVGPTTNFKSGGSTVTLFDMTPTAGIVTIPSSVTMATTGTYQMAATTPFSSLAAANSNSFAVAAFDVKSKVGFVQGPGNATYGVNIAPAVTVAIQDQYGNTVTTATDSVSIALGTDANPTTTLSGGASKPAVSGVVTFAGLNLNKTGTGYTVVASSSALASATSGSFSVGAETQLGMLVQPGASLVGQPIAPAPQVAFQDAAGNTVTLATGTITASRWSGSGSLSGTTTVATVNGVATFADLRWSATTSFAALLFTSGPLASVVTPSFAVTLPPATTLAFTTQPSGVVRNATFTVAVTVRDAFGATVTSGSPSITVSLAASDSACSTPTLGGTLTQNASSGVATFTGLTLDCAGSGFKLQAVASGLTTAESDAFDVAAFGTATQLVMLVQPGASLVGQPITPAPQVAIQDAGGNTVITETSTITAAGWSGYSPTGTVSVAAVNGVATFTDLRIPAPTGSEQLYFYSGSLAYVVTPSFAVTLPPATALAFTTQPSGVARNATFTVVVTVRDAFGGTVTSGAPSITVSLAASDPACGTPTLGGTLTQNASSGVATFTGLTLDCAGSGFKLQAVASGLTTAESDAFDVAAFGTATQLVMLVQPGASLLGQPITPAPQVAIQDAGGNTVTSATSTITAAIYQGYSVSGTLSVAAVNGVATFADLRMSGAEYSSSRLYFYSGSLPYVVTPSFAVTLPPATALAFTTQPSGVVRNATFTVAVTVRDAFGGTVTSGAPSITVSLAASDPACGTPTLGGTLTQNASSGVATFAGLTLDCAGSGFKLQAVASGLTTAESDAFDVAAFGTATQLVMLVQPGASFVGQPITPAPQVEIRDAVGNKLTTATNTITAQCWNGCGTVSGTTSVAAVNGVATFADLRMSAASSVSQLRFTSGSLAVVTATFTETVPPATTLVFTTQPSNATAGATISPSVQVTVQNAFGGTVTSASTSITLSITSGTGTAGAVLGGTVTRSASSGVATFSNLTIIKAGTAYTLSATATGLTSDTSTAFTVSVGPASKLGVLVQPSAVTAGSAISPAVQIAVQDASGNTVTSATTSVTVAITGGTGTGGAVLSGTVTQAAVNGIATFDNLTIDKAGTGYTLTTTATGLTGATSTSFTVSSAAAAKLTVVAQPSTVTAGSALSPAIQIAVQDALGNTVTSATASVAVAITSGTGTGGATLGGTVNQTAVNGIATFSNLTIDKAGAGYSLTATGATLTSATTNNITVNAGAATKLAWLDQPQATFLKAPLNPSGQLPRIAIQDALGNTVTTNNSTTIRLAVGVGPTSSFKSGASTVTTFNMTPTSGIATIPGTITMSTAGNYQLSASTPFASLTSATSDAFTAAAFDVKSKLGFVQGPTNTTYTVNMAPAVTVAVQDQYGNTVTTATDPISIAIGTDANGPTTLTGGGAVSPVNGVATFAALSLNTTGTGYTLVASATGLASVTSGPFSMNAFVPTKLTLLVQPGASLVGQPITPAPQVAIQDAAGNTVITETSTITAAGWTGYSPTGTVSVAAVNGVATFTDLRIPTAYGSEQLYFTSGSLAYVVTTAFAVTNPPATALEFTTQPSGVVRNATFTVAVTVRDAFGGTVTSGSPSITVSLAASDPACGTPTLGGTLTRTASSGVATFSGLTIDCAGSGFKLQAVSSGLTTAESSTFNVAAFGAATQLAMLVQPGASIVGQPITPAPQVAIRDAAGNTVADASSTITAAGWSGFNPTGTVNVAAVNGVATFTDLRIPSPYGSEQLYFTSGSLAYAVTNAFAVTSLSAPSSLTATAVSSTQINLSWTDNASNEDGFRIERCEGVSCSSFAEITTVGANVTTYQNTGLTAATSYTYRVRAYNAVGNSGYTGTPSATTTPNPPNAPSGLTATATSTTQINLSWTDNASDEDGFKIERCIGVSCSSFAEIATVAASVTSYQNTALTPVTSYSYRVRAYNAGGNSGFSGTSSATTLAPNPPSAPSGLTATAISSAQINLAWTDNSGDEDGFRIERCSGASCSNFAEIATVAANVTTYASTGLSAVTNYSYRVQAYNAGGTSSYTGTASATTPTTSPDLTITAFSAPDAAPIGGNINISVTVLNQGTATSGSFRIGFYFSSDATVTTGDTQSGGYCDFPSGLAPSGSNTCTGLIAVPGSLSSGTYYVAAIADDFGQVSESNESNNVSSAPSIVTAPSNLIANGSFTSGDSLWTTSGNAYVTTTQAYYYTSSGYANLATDVNGTGVNSANGTLYQDISIPAGASTASLQFRLNITTAESPTSTTQWDKLIVTVRNTSSTILATLATFSNVDHDAGAGSAYYTAKSFSLTPYVGQTIRIYFQGTSDSVLPTIFRIDDVAVTWN